MHAIQRPPTSGVPVGMRPPSRTRDGISTTTPKEINVVSRPLTRGGLPSATTQSSERRVADKLYFTGILRTKINEILKEIKHLQNQIDQKKRDQSIKANLEQTVVTLQKEITKSEEELTDYNMLSENVQNGIHIDDIITQFQQLEQSNLRFEEEVNKNYREMKELEKMVLEQEKNYQNMMNRKGFPELQTLAKEIELIEAKCSELKNSTIDLNGKTREQLLQMVRDTTIKIGDIQKLIQNEQSSLTFINNQIKKLDEKENDLQTDRGKQYLRLLQKEKDMNSFIQNFQDNLNQTKTEIAKTQKHVYETLKNTSSDIESVDSLPTQKDYSQITKNLEYKEKQVKVDHFTIHSLQQEVENRRSALEHLNEIDKKILDEIEHIKLSIKKMKEEMPNFEDIDMICREWEIKKKNKMIERDQLKLQLNHLKKTTNYLASKYNKLNYQIKTDNVYSKLHALEKDIRDKALENNAIMESIEEKKRLTNYAIVKRSALNIVNEINNLL